MASEKAEAESELEAKIWQPPDYDTDLSEVGRELLKFHFYSADAKRVRGGTTWQDRQRPHRVAKTMDD